MKLSIKTIVFFIAIVLSTKMQSQNKAIYKDASQPIESRVKDLQKRMTLEEKVSYVTGAALKNRQEAIRGNKRLGIPDFIIAHGPFGMKIKKLRPNNRVLVEAGTYFPVSIAMAATWDVDKVKEITSTIGKEMNAVGAMSNAGPAMNIIRDPRTGRSFEYFTEDPYLNGEIASAYTKGIQQEKIAAILKHYIVNNQELNRHRVDVDVSERALREIYLPGFKKAVTEANARVIMGAYNKVNGVYSCENPFLLQDVLRGDWGFDGFVLSDWAGVQSTAPSANNGLDVEMPRAKWFGKKLLDAVKQGEVKEETIDTMVSNVLRVVFWSGAFDQGPMYDTKVVRSKEHLQVARSASSEAIVLLKNETNNLPVDLKKVKSIAVIGPNGDYGKHYLDGAYNIGLLQGGGSSKLNTYKENMVTPLQGIKANVPRGVKVAYEPGCYAESGFGLIPLNYLSAKGKEGLEIAYYGNSSFEGEPLKREMTNKRAFRFSQGLDIPEAGNEKVSDKNKFSIELTSELEVPESGDYEFELRNEGGDSQMFINGQLLIENKKGSRVNWNSEGKINLEKGKKYTLLVKYANFGQRVSNLRIGWNYENKMYLEKAKELARKSDVVFLTVGLSAQMGETEAGDRRTLALASAQETLIKEITKINKNTSVILTAGSAVTMDKWINDAPTILTAWYPGEQGGNGIADVLFGKVNPSGKLPITFPKSYSQYPEDFYAYDLDVHYKEGIYVGYRYFDKFEKDPLFPFGHGLSYTSFKYSKIKVSKKKVKVTIENTGDYEGKEVVQLYVRDLESSVDRPLKELKGFQKVSLEKGQKKTITFELTDEAFAFWDDASKAWKAEPGQFEILVGSSSTDIRLTTKLTIK